MSKPSTAAEQAFNENGLAPPDRWQALRPQNYTPSHPERLKPLLDFLGMKKFEELGSLVLHEPVARDAFDEFFKSYPTEAQVPAWQVKEILQHFLRGCREAQLIGWKYEPFSVAGRTRLTFWVPAELDKRVRREAFEAGQKLSDFGAEILDAGATTAAAKRNTVAK